MAKGRKAKQPVECVAYGYASGEIGFGGVVPRGALLIAPIANDDQMSAVQANCRLAYDNKTYLVPDVPEADSQSEGIDAFIAFVRRMQAHPAFTA